MAMAVDQIPNLAGSDSKLDAFPGAGEVKFRGPLYLGVSLLEAWERRNINQTERMVIVQSYLAAHKAGFHSQLDGDAYLFYCLCFRAYEIEKMTPTDKITLVRVIPAFIRSLELVDSVQKLHVVFPEVSVGLVHGQYPPRQNTGQGLLGAILPPLKSSRKHAPNFVGLDPSLQGFLRLILHLHDKEVPEDILLCGSHEKLVWKRNGETSSVNLDIYPTLTDSECFVDALHQLVDAGFLETQTRTSLRRTFRIPATVRELVHIATPRPTSSILEAMKFVLHVFPDHRHIEPFRCAQIAKATVPLLRFVLEHLHLKAAVNLLKPHHLDRVIEVSLSATHFLPYDEARQLLDRIQAFAWADQMKARITMRELALKRLHLDLSPQELKEEWETAHSTGFSNIPDQRTNAYLGDGMLLYARLLIDQGKYEDAIRFLGQFRAREKKVSAMEENVMEEMTVIKAIALRCLGKFQDARACLSSIKRGTMLDQELITHMSGLECELSVIQTTGAVLQAELEHMDPTMDGDIILRTKIALADAELMRGMSSAGDGVSRAKFIYEDCETQIARSDLTKDVKTLRCWVYVALAIIAQTDTADTHECVKNALDRWQTATSAVRQCNMPTGYVDAIIAYSRSELLRRLDRMSEATELEERAARLYCRTGPTHQFTGLATVWPRLVSDMTESRGGRRLEDMVRGSP